METKSHNRSSDDIDEEFDECSEDGLEIDNGFQKLLINDIQTVIVSMCKVLVITNNYCQLAINCMSNSQQTNNWLYS